MLEIYAMYNLNGYITGIGRVDRDKLPNGHTMQEHIDRKLIAHPDRSVMYLPNQKLFDRDKDWVKNGMVKKMNPPELAAYEAWKAIEFKSPIQQKLDEYETRIAALENA